MPAMEIVFVVLAMAVAAGFKNQLRVSVEAGHREPVNTFIWGLVGGIAFAILMVLALKYIPKNRELVFVLLALPFLSFLYAVGSVGLVRLIWDDAFKFRFVIIPVMMTFGYILNKSFAYGGRVNLGLFAFGFGCIISGMRWYDREAEVAGVREEKVERPVVAGSTGKMKDITPIFRDKDGRYPGAPPNDE